MRSVVKTMPQLLYPQERDPVLLAQEAGYTPGPVQSSAENLASPTGIHSLDCPACSESLYKLRYPGSPAVFYVALKVVPSIWFTSPWPRAASATEIGWDGDAHCSQSLEYTTWR